ncbi:MAG: flagellin [Gammaproteobacteria bacterium]|nr:flagellin [Planctomycetota bacterium]MCP5198669.1 flagellin [Gammaproteobacteria bacterium]
MPQTINTNIMSLNAQRNLNRTQSDLTTTIQRLSSGLRINSAKDDAAGLAISTRMSTQINGLSVAIRNANDGISIAQTAEGAMDEMVKSLIRANDLALQAASYNTDADRTSLNQEVNQIVDELSRVVSQTRYNGQALLAGGFSADIQVGTNVNETINVSISNLAPSGLGVASSYTAVSTASDATFADRIRNTNDTLLDGTTDSLNGVVLSGVAAGSTSDAKIDAINTVTSQTGVKAFGYGNAAVASTDVTDADATGAGQNIGAGALTINGVSVDGNGAGTTLANLVTNINAKSGETGVTAVLDAGGAANQSRLVLINRTGAAINVTVADATTAASTGFAVGDTTVDAGSNGLVVLNDSLGTSAVTFDAAATGSAITGVAAATETLADATVSSQNVSTQAGANLALLAFQAGLDQLNSDRAVLGAKLNRFDSTIRNLENVRENVTAARGRIQDADFAMETASLTRAQILQQAGIAMVSQANSVPQAALALLQ